MCFGMTVFNTDAQVFERPDFKGDKMTWIVRAGANFNSATGDWKDKMLSDWKDSHNIDFKDGTFPSNTSFDVSIAFNKSIKQLPSLYWGMEMGVSTRGYKANAEWESGHISSTWGDYIGHRIEESQTLMAYNAYFTPVMFGYKYELLSNMTLDAHIGAFASYDFAGNSKRDTYDWQTSSGKDRVKESSSKTSLEDLKDYSRFDAGMNIGIGVWFGHFNLDFSWQRGFVNMFDSDYSIKSQSLKLRLGYAF